MKAKKFAVYTATFKVPVSGGKTTCNNFFHILIFHFLAWFCISLPVTSQKLEEINQFQQNLTAGQFNMLPLPAAPPGIESTYHPCCVHCYFLSVGMNVLEPAM